ncbi:uncharacterized [Tachysurus ichikawai]
MNAGDALQPACPRRPGSLGPGPGTEPPLVLSLLPERRPLFLRLLPLMNTRADIPTAAKAVVFSISLSHFPPLTPLWSALIRVLSDFV